MIVKLLTEHRLEFLGLKGGCRGSSESTLVKMSHCWKSLATAHMALSVGVILNSNSLTYSDFYFCSCLGWLLVLFWWGSDSWSCCYVSNVGALRGCDKCLESQTGFCYIQRWTRGKLTLVNFVICAMVFKTHYPLFSVCYQHHNYSEVIRAIMFKKLLDRWHHVTE